MPDPNNPLETALREIREIVPTDLDKKVMTVVRSILINFRNLESRETVICAAVKTVEGKIIRGHRHDGAMKYAWGMGLHLVPYTEDPQGFITSTGRYVNREEAAAIQKAAGIKTVDPNRIDFPTELFSEDLY